MSRQNTDAAVQLRARALARFNSQAAAHPAPKSTAQVRALLQELQVHQIELEMQNEALSVALQSADAERLRYIDLYDFAPSGLFTLARTGMVVQSNLMGARLLQVERSALLEQPLHAFVPHTDAEQVAELLKQVFSGVRPHAIELHLSGSQGPHRTVQIEAGLASNGRECCIAMFDVTDRRQLEQARSRAAALEVAQQADEAVIQAKAAFISSMSHELRTPLNAILGFTQLLQIDQQHVLDEQQFRRTQAVMVAGKQLLQLVDDVLDLAQMEGGRLRVDSSPIEIGVVLDEALKTVGPVMDGSGLTLSVERVPNDMATQAQVRADRARLVQVLVNLLSNAIKYNVPGGAVRIIVDATPLEAVRIAVEDNGCGMDQAQLADAFEPFNRVGRERADIPGIGIGLAITKWLVELMGGTLQAWSEVGKGSRFDVLMPSVGHVSAERAANDPPAKRPCNVLCIDPHVLHASLMADVVAMQPSFQIHLASSMKDGVAMATRLRPKIVMVDLNLPDCKGLAALHRLRQADGMQAAKFVVVSADTAPSAEQAALAAGADAYVNKPINVVEVLTLLSRSA